jgi:hypothetical protein
MAQTATAVVMTSLSAAMSSANSEAVHHHREVLPRVNRGIFRREETIADTVVVATIRGALDRHVPQIARSCRLERIVRVRLSDWKA